MLTIINNNTDPRFNLAVEEYVLKHLNLDEDILLVWQNSKSVIISRYQNPFLELNGEFINNNNIPVIRKDTDGEAIFHDLGCINYAFVTKREVKNTNRNNTLLDPVVSVLRSLGINVNIKKSNIYIGKDKVTLNSQSKYKNKTIHHGILFIDTNFTTMNKVHKKSITDLVNIKKHFKQLMTVSMFRLTLLNELLGGEVTSKIYKLDEFDLEKINELVKTKYGNWEWNYGESAEFLVKKEYENRMLITLIIKKGIIKDLSIDSFGNTIKLEKALINIRFNELALKSVLNEFKEINPDEMIKLLMY